MCNEEKGFANLFSNYYHLCVSYIGVDIKHKKIVLDLAWWSTNLYRGILNLALIKSSINLILTCILFTFNYLVICLIKYVFNKDEALSSTLVVSPLICSSCSLKNMFFIASMYCSR